MALAINIEELLNGKVIEWERLEFKEGWDPKDVLHTLCAFANDMNNWGGGYIIIGVEEQNGRPVLPPKGLDPDRIDGIQKKLLNLSFKILPNYSPISQPYVYEEQHILVIYAPAGDARPYSAPAGLGNSSDDKQRFNYIRSSSSTMAAKGESLRKLQSLAARIPFDDRMNHRAELNDLSLGLIRDFLQEIGSDLFAESERMPFPDLCRQMAIAKGPDEALKPVNAGLMFFSQEPHRFFNRARIEIVLRSDEAGREFTEKYYEGPLHKQLREALDYIKSILIEEKTKKIEGQAEAERFYNYPFEAVEEALANAVYHKSYELSKPIEVQIWPDRMEILSFPGPVPPVDAEILEKNRRIVSRDYRNRRVGDFLKELHLTEGRGTGIPIIHDVMKQNGSPEPAFETDDACTYFLTVLYSHSEFTADFSDQVTDQGDQDGVQGSVQDNQQSDQDSGQDSVQDDDIVSDQDLKNDQDNDIDSDIDKDKVAAVLNFCKTPKPRKEILNNLGLKKHYDNYKRHILPALDRKWLTMTKPDKPTSKHQKYRTTEKGRKILKKWSN